ncbi:MAG: hypothetical protein H8E10_17290 [Desulfobacterales bacterium]|nr:hypothetical protein [Desulfobacterales bacterium]
MTNSKERKRAIAIIEKILEFTDEEYLQRRIDRPVEKVFAAFEYDKNARISHRYFMDIVGDFVHRIYLHGPGTSQYLSHTQACAEALLIIEKAFGSHDVQGYDAAIVAAFTDLESVLAKIIEFVISRTRERHIRWVYATCIDPFDWPTRCLVAEILLERWKPFLPPSILSCTPAQLVDALPQLFSAAQSTEIMVKKTMTSDTEFYGFSESLSETLEQILPLSQSEGT